MKKIAFCSNLMKAGASLTTTVLTVITLVSCVNTKTTTGRNDVPYDKDKLFGLSLWMVRQQEKLENGFPILDPVDSYTKAIAEYLENPEQLCMYWSPANRLTQGELTQYLGQPTNFNVLEAYAFPNEVEKDTFYRIRPIHKNPFQSDTLYLDFVTTFFPEGDSITAIIHITDYEPYMVKVYKSGTGKFLPEP